MFFVKTITYGEELVGETVIINDSNPLSSAGMSKSVYYKFT